MASQKSLENTQTWQPDQQRKTENEREGNRFRASRRERETSVTPGEAVSAGGLRQHEDSGRPRGRKAMLHLRHVAQQKEKKKKREQEESRKRLGISAKSRGLRK